MISDEELKTLAEKKESGIPLTSEEEKSLFEALNEEIVDLNQTLKKVQKDN